MQYCNSDSCFLHIFRFRSLSSCISCSIYLSIWLAFTLSCCQSLIYYFILFLFLASHSGLSMPMSLSLHPSPHLGLFFSLFSTPHSIRVTSSCIIVLFNFFAMAWLTSTAFPSILYLPAPFHQPPRIPNTPLYTTKSYNPPPTKTLEAAGANPVSPSADEWFKPEGPLLQQDLNANSASSWIKP